MADLHLSQKIVAYHNPYNRLNFRVEIEDILSRCNIGSRDHVYDLAAIFDAVYKRGGVNRVREDNRIEQIRQSLPYYHVDFMKVYEENLSPNQRMISRQLRLLPEVSKQPLIEAHLLPVMHSPFRYYSTNSNKNEHAFMQQYFTNQDEYYCLKSLAFYGGNLSKLHKAYTYKYYILRKWLFVHGYIEINDKAELNIFGINSSTLEDRPQRTHLPRICIVGMNIANMILARKLAQVGFKVTICEQQTKNEQCVDYVSRDVVAQGIFLINKVDKLRLISLLAQYTKIQIESISQENLSNTVPDRHESTFIQMLQEILTEAHHNNNRKLVVHELLNKVSAFNSLSQKSGSALEYGSQQCPTGPEFLKMHLERYIMINRLKDQASLTVGELRSYLDMESKQKNYSTSNNAFTYQSYSYGCKIKLGLREQPYYLSNKNQEEKKIDDSLKINKFNRFCSAKFNQETSKWTVTWACLGQVHPQLSKPPSQLTQEFEYLVYGNQSVLSQAIITSQYNLEEIITRQVSAGFIMLERLSVHRQIHCLFNLSPQETDKFSENRTDNSYVRVNNNYCAYFSRYGIVHFYRLENTKEVMAVLRRKKKYNHMPLTEFYREISWALREVVLEKNIETQSNPINQSDPMIEESSFFSLKDESMYESIINAKTAADHPINMYFTLPIISSCCKNIVQSQVFVNNHIFEDILMRELFGSGTHSKCQGYSIHKDRCSEYAAGKKRQQRKVEGKGYISGVNNPKFDGNSISLENSRMSESGVESQKLFCSYSKQQRDYSYEKSGEFKDPSESRNSKHKLKKQGLDCTPYNEGKDKKGSRLEGQSSSWSRQPSVSNSLLHRSEEQRVHDRIGIYLTKSLCSTVEEELERDVSKSVDYLLPGNRIHKICQSYLRNLQQGYRHKKSGEEPYLLFIGLPIKQSSHPDAPNNPYEKVKTSIEMHNLITIGENYCISASVPVRTLYCQCVLPVDGKVYYCITELEPEDKTKQILFYHTSLYILFERFKQALTLSEGSRLKQQKSCRTSLRTMRENVQIHSEYLLPSVMAEIIQRQTRSTSDDIDAILRRKLNSLKGSEMGDRYHLPYDTYQQNRQYYIIKEMESFTSWILKTNQMKNYSAVEIFWGKVNSKRIGLEMLHRLIGGQQDSGLQQPCCLSDRQDQESVQRYIQECDNGCRFDRFGLVISAGSETTLITRRFLTDQRYGFCPYREYQLAVNSQHWLASFEVTEPDQKDHQSFGGMVRDCLNRYRAGEIIEAFKELVLSELSQWQDMKMGVLRLYFKMTRLSLLKNLVSDDQAHSFMDRARNKIGDWSATPNSEFDPTLIIKAYRNGNLKIIGDDFVCLV